MATIEEIHHPDGRVSFRIKGPYVWGENMDGFFPPEAEVPAFTEASGAHNIAHYAEDPSVVSAEGIPGVDESDQALPAPLQHHTDKEVAGTIDLTGFLSNEATGNIPRQGIHFVPSSRS